MLGFTKTQEKKLLKDGLDTVEKVSRLFPKKYIDLSQWGVPHDGYKGVFCGLLKKVDVKKKIVYAIVNCLHVNVYVKWFNMDYIYKEIYTMQGKYVLIQGTIVSFNGFLQCNNPRIFWEFKPDLPTVYPIYKKYPGISEENLKSKIELACQSSDEDEIFPQWVREEYGLPDIETAKRMLHNPRNQQDIYIGTKWKYVQEILFFAIELQRQRTSTNPPKIENTEIAEKIISSLPFQLTDDQRDTYQKLAAKMKAGERVDALVQGDVGSGKTIVAALLMACAAGSGFQSVIFAPTTVLAKQHFEEMSKYFEPLGIHVALLISEQKAAEKRKFLNGIEKGEYQVIVGTHSVLSAVYKNLALVISDEEHRFGVVQRDRLKDGCHVVSMSATPIPRTITSLVFTQKEVCNIHTMPNGRKPIKTFLTQNRESIFRFLEKEINEGHQAYVICPLIDQNEKLELLSVSEAIEMYETYFSAKNIKIGTLDGKMKNGEAVIQDFKDGKTQILISTTVVEVGVNVPNATVIVIENAERFGLSSLHQLRGRVGRNSLQSYCILQSQDVQNQRLKAMCESNDGFYLANRDFELRGPGNLIGVEQSGADQIFETVCRNPKTYSRAICTAQKMLEDGSADKFVEHFRKVMVVKPPREEKHARSKKKDSGVAEEKPADAGQG